MKTVVKCSQNKHHSRSESPCYYVRMRRMNNCPIFGSIPIFILRFCWSWSGARPLGVRMGPKPPRYSKKRWQTMFITLQQRVLIWHKKYKRGKKVWFGFACSYAWMLLKSLLLLSLCLWRWLVSYWKQCRSDFFAALRITLLCLKICYRFS